MSSGIHQVAQAGFGKGTNELYDRARPTYPASALSYIRSSLPNSPPFNVLEIGSGTGIFTRALLAHPEWKSAVGELRAVEPSEGMRERFLETVKDERASVKDGAFEVTHVPDGWADLIVIAQAFHWCPDYSKAVAEFNRALSPNGRVVLIWNLEDARTPWVGQLRDVVEDHEKGTPQYRLGLWRQAFSTNTYIKFFEPPVEKRFEHSVTATLDAVIERAFTKSYIAIASEEAKTRVRKGVTEVVTKGEGKEWLNETEGTFKYPYITTVVVLKKSET
ncbi:hypothetical protein M422DRAFT_208284 [Sphaerobolus stellatus SS14]|uniref:Methyltransferase type 11 domain-containing protein n=1 Tax=Sphaerobolus stellatus (strain SS14) TaxID=990650 RepID=A0A0C9VZQ1_SPHS4|nr:hypothetical protein M422DRAFT_208284 [Sphaerobolus stellatus SS14]